MLRLIDQTPGRRDVSFETGFGEVTAGISIVATRLTRLEATDSGSVQISRTGIQRFANN